MVKPLMWEYQGKLGTLQDLLNRRNITAANSHCCDLVSHLLSASPKIIAWTKDPRASDVLDRCIDRFEFKLNKEGYVLFEKKNLRFVRYVNKEAEVLYFIQTIHKPDFQKFVHNLANNYIFPDSVSKFRSLDKTLILKAIQ